MIVSLMITNILMMTIYWLRNACLNGSPVSVREAHAIGVSGLTLVV
jgi:hypothetical protein